MKSPFNMGMSATGAQLSDIVGEGKARLVALDK